MSRSTLFIEIFSISFTSPNPNLHINRFRSCLVFFRYCNCIKYRVLLSTAS